MEEYAAFLQKVAQVIELASVDEEVSHAYQDEITEQALRAVVDGKPFAKMMADSAIALMNQRDAEEWIRWYA